MRLVRRRYWILSALAVPLGLGLLWFIFGQSYQQATLGSPAELATDIAIELGTALGLVRQTAIPVAQYRLEVVAVGPQDCHHTIAINTSSQSVRDECQIFPGAAMRENLSSQGMLGIRGPFDPDNPYPAVQLLGTVTVIENEQIIVDGQAIALPQGAKRVEFRERHGSVDILADSQSIHHFTR